MLGTWTAGLVSLALAGEPTEEPTGEPTEEPTGEGQAAPTEAALPTTATKTSPQAIALYQKGRAITKKGWWVMGAGVGVAAASPLWMLGDRWRLVYPTIGVGTLMLPTGLILTHIGVLKSNEGFARDGRPTYTGWSQASIALTGLGGGMMTLGVLSQDTTFGFVPLLVGGFVGIPGYFFVKYQGQDLAMRTGGADLSLRVMPLWVGSTDQGGERRARTGASGDADTGGSGAIEGAGRGEHSVYRGYGGLQLTGTW